MVTGGPNALQEQLLNSGFPPIVMRRRQKAQGEMLGSTWPGSGHFSGVVVMSRTGERQTNGGSHLSIPRFSKGHLRHRAPGFWPGGVLLGELRRPAPRALPHSFPQSTRATTHSHRATGASPLVMSEANKNILLVIPCFGFGGAQQVFHDHSVELSSRFNVTECVFNLDLPDVYPSGNPVVSLGVGGGASLVAKLQSFYHRYANLKKIKRDKKIALSISHLEGADYANLLSRVGESTIAVIHGSKVHDDSMVGWSGWLRQRILLPYFYRRPDHIVTVSRELRQEMIGYYRIAPEKVTVINNFFYTDQLLAKAQEPIEAQYEPLFSLPHVLVTSGRFAPQKNQLPLLDIFAGLLKRQPDSKLVILGDGERRALLLERAQALGLRAYKAWDNDPLDQDYDVYFLGFQKNPFRYIRRATLFVFPSEWEGFPLALCEAMVCGVPVVTTDCPTGPREILAPTTPPTHVATTPEWADYGVLMPLLDANFRQHALGEWVDTLANLLNDPARRAHYAQLGQQRMQDFTPAKMMDKWLHIIDGVLARR